MAVDDAPGRRSARHARVVVWHGDIEPPRLYFVTVRTSQKARNLRARPAIVAHVGSGDDVVQLLGRAEIVGDPAEIERVDEAYRTKYVDPYSGRRASVHDNREDDVYRLAPGRVVAWMYGAVGTWTEWRARRAGDGAPGR